jgi:hypothetical protein
MDRRPVEAKSGTDRRSRSHRISRSALMNSTDRLGRAIVDADPLSRRRPALPSVDEEIVAARAFIGPVASPQSGLAV